MAEKGEAEAKGPVEFSFFSVIKSLVGQIKLGTDVTRITLPSCFCVPYSMLELIGRKRARGMETIRDIKKIEDPVGRMLCVIRWYLCSITEDEFGKKPLNPVINETFKASSSSCPDAIFVAEQVSHHPPISAFRFTDEESGIYYEGTLEVRSKFHGNSVSANWHGAGDLKIDDEEVYSWNRHYPPLFAKGLIFGARRMELEGDVLITCAKTGLEAHLDFKTSEKKVAGENKFVYTVKGAIRQPKGKTIVGITGSCNSKIHVVWPKGSKEIELPFLEGDVLLDMGKIPTADMNPIVPESEEEKKRFSTCVWAETMEALKKWDYQKADEEKKKVEDMERTYRLSLEQSGGQCPPPSIFEPVPGNSKDVFGCQSWTLKKE